MTDDRHQAAVPALAPRRDPVARIRARWLMLAIACSMAPSSALATPLDDAQILAAARGSFPELMALLAIPNDAIVTTDIARNAAWLEGAFEKRGFVAQQLLNDGRPMLFAEYPSARRNTGTVLFYMHFDGQPVLPEQWSQSDPWRPVVKKRGDDGGWTVVDPAELQATPFDPELRVYARSASDDKGPIVMFLACFDAMKSAGRSPAFNVKVLLDSTEEKGSPGIDALASAHADLLRADALVIHDGPQHPSNQPTLVFGNRGVTEVTLTVYGPKNPLHSGHYGNYVPNPAQRLARLLATMKDDDGRVTIPGYYDTVKLGAAERQSLAEVGDDEPAMLKRLGIARPDRVGENYQEALQYPSLNIRGMQSGAIGDKAANIVPNLAVASLDLRTTPEAGPELLVDLIEQHIRNQGWYLTPGEPSDAERAAHDKIASLTIAEGSRAVRTPMDSPLADWAAGALARTLGDGASDRLVRIRMMGGSVPTDQLVAALELPFVIVPLVNGDNNQHSFDENLRMGHYLTGMRTMLALLLTPYPPTPAAQRRSADQGTARPMALKIAPVALDTPAPNPIGGPP